MRPCPRSRFLDRALGAGIALALLALRPAPARAQACCSGGSVVTPTRLAVYEDYAVGVQTRARSNLGSFGADGRYVAAGSEQVLEQDLAASVRLGGRAQVGALLPMLETHRSETGIDEWGGGVGDLTLTGRYDLLLAADARLWPGISLLLGLTAPTGTSPEGAHKLLGTDATGAGSWDGSAGVAFEKVSRHGYAALNLWLTYRRDRTITPPMGPSFRHSFGLRATALAVGGYVFDSRAALALYASVFNEGDASDDGVEKPGSGPRMTTVGAAGVLPLAESWRLQGAAFSDVMIASFGRNEHAGLGLTASLVRVWM
jgi:hypothetical protein